MSSNDRPDGDRLEPERQQPSGIQRMDAPAPSPSTEVYPDTSSGGSQVPVPSTPSSGSSTKTLIRLLIIAVLAVGGWFFFGHSGKAVAGVEQEAPMYQKQLRGPSPTPATFTAADLDRARSDGAREAALRGDPIPGISNPSPEFVQSLKDGKVSFYAVRLYDTCVEDGDVVTLRLGSGVDIGPVPLTNAGTTITVPVVSGQPPQVTVIGVKDGTGGITVGVQTSGGMWYSGIIPEGGTETMPLAVR